MLRRKERWIALEPSHLSEVDLAYRMGDASIKIAQPGMSRKMRRKLQRFDEIIRQYSRVHLPDRLVVDLLDRIAIGRKRFGYGLTSGNRTAMR